jgi:D-alanine-D-alanine ligase
MIIGLTYDLREEYLAEGYDEEETAEFDRPDTIDAIEWALQNLGFKTDRIGHIKNLAARLVRGERWDLVFNIAEGLRGFSREAQVPALLDAYEIPYTFSDPLVLSLTLHKAMAKHVVRDLGIPTPDFMIIEEDSDIEMIDLPYPLFAKPVAEGTGKGVTSASKILTRNELVAVCGGLLAKYRQPVLIETFLPGRELTVGIIGTGNEAVAVGVLEVVLKGSAEPVAYSYVNKERCEELVEYRLVNDAMAEEAKNVARAVWRGLGCRDVGRIDFRADHCGILNFMEVNPLPGLHPEHSDLPILCTLVGITYHELIDRIMQSALRRLDCSPPGMHYRTAARNKRESFQAVMPQCQGSQL